MCWFVPIEQLYPPLFTLGIARQIHVAEFSVGQFKMFPMQQDLQQLNHLNAVGKL